MHASRILRARGAICAAVLILTAAFTAASAASTARAADHGAPQDMAAPSQMAGAHKGGGHGSAPAGVTGAHMVPAGAMMLTYSPMFMHMEGNKIGTKDVSPEAVATLPNRFSPPHAKFLRVVPTEMDMEMHMLGAMFGLSDSFNLMVMGSYVHKEMEMLTFKGMAGTTVLGTSSAATEGVSDGAIVGLIRVYDDGVHHVHANLGVSLPIGSTTETVTMLAPTGMQMTMRASYGMQLGSGTFDALPGLTYTGKHGSLSWGLIYRGRVPLEDGHEGWRFGNQHEASAWLGYMLTPGVIATGRVLGSTQGRIRGIDPKIQGAMQALDPDNYGGDRVDLLGGIELRGQPFGLGNTRLAIEAGAPVHQDLNGPQLGRDWMLTVSLGARF